MIKQPEKGTRDVTDLFYEAERKRIEMLNNAFFRDVELTEEENILNDIKYECYYNAFINGWIDTVEFVDRYDDTVNDMLMRVYENEIISKEHTETIENYIKEGYNKGKQEASEYYEIPIDND